MVSRIETKVEIRATGSLAACRTLSSSDRCTVHGWRPCQASHWRQRPALIAAVVYTGAALEEAKLCMT